MSIKENFLDKSQATYTQIVSKCLIVSNYSAVHTKTKTKSLVAVFTVTPTQLNWNVYVSTYVLLTYSESVQANPPGGGTSATQGASQISVLCYHTTELGFSFSYVYIATLRIICFIYRIFVSMITQCLQPAELMIVYVTLCPLMKQVSNYIDVCYM